MVAVDVEASVVETVVETVAAMVVVVVVVAVEEVLVTKVAVAFLAVEVAIAPAMEVIVDLLVGMVLLPTLQLVQVAAVVTAPDTAEVAMEALDRRIVTGLAQCQSQPQQETATNPVVDVPHTTTGRVVAIAVRAVVAMGIAGIQEPAVAAIWNPYEQEILGIPEIQEMLVGTKTATAGDTALVRATTTLPERDNSRAMITRRTQGSCAGTKQVALCLWWVSRVFSRSFPLDHLG